MGVPAHCNLLCLEKKRPPEREGPRERRGEGAEGRRGARGHSRPREPCKDTDRGHRQEEGGTETERPGEEGSRGTDTRWGKRGDRLRRVGL